MDMLTALLMELSFSEALFRVHHTQGFKLTFPIPLPTSVAGMFGAMLGLERCEIPEKFSEFLFGAKAKCLTKISAENATFLQYKPKGVERGVAPISLLNRPIFHIAIAGDRTQIDKIKSKIKNGIVYQPYGGQNDFFCEDWKIKEMVVVNSSKEISNYCPEDWVENIRITPNSDLMILPVKHTLSSNMNFYFIINGTLHLKKEVPCATDIALYSLKDFIYQTWQA
jgi:CRISPR-associated Cas5-like protein